MTLTLSVEEISRDFEGCIRRVVDERVTIIVTMNEKAVAEIVPLAQTAQVPDWED
ncbi:MAG TPA: hypothetical protein PLK77_14865 [Pyrinomonadaceae bacterium]|nr:hypothetical protein [Pyrinomonadaceae bacterium]